MPGEERSFPGGSPEPGCVGEADAPGAIPGAVRALLLLSEALPAPEGILDLGPAVVWVLVPELCQRSHAGGSALHIAVVDHDVPKGLRGVDQLHSMPGTFSNTLMEIWPISAAPFGIQKGATVIMSSGTLACCEASRQAVKGCKTDGCTAHVQS